MRKEPQLSEYLLGILVLMTPSYIESHYLNNT
jgi:hypothetical protein